MKTRISAAIVLLALTDARAQVAVSTGTAAPTATVQQWSTIATDQPGVSSVPTPMTVVSGLQQSGDAGDQARNAVLVVPGPDLKAQTLTALTEDLTVMCRIFDKALQPRGRSTAAAWSYATRPGAMNHWFVHLAGQTQGLYVDGYGAIFFVGVDFPLVAPPARNEPAKAQDTTDRVWSQTIDELRGRRDVDATDEAQATYDPQKVDTLKATLINTLRHAANLRLGPQEQVTVVAGNRNRSSSAGVQQQLRFLYERSAGRRRTVTPSGTGRPDKPAADPAAGLVLRVAKADLDALAAGTLSAEQFAPKVTVSWSQTQPPAAEPPSTQPTSLGRRR